MTCLQPLHSHLDRASIYRNLTLHAATALNQRSRFESRKSAESLSSKVLGIYKGGLSCLAATIGGVQALFLKGCTTAAENYNWAGYAQRCLSCVVELRQYHMVIWCLNVGSRHKLPFA